MTTPDGLLDAAAPSELMKPSKLIVIEKFGVYGKGSHPLVDGIPPKWAYGWGQLQYAVFVDFKKIRFLWHPAGFWFGEISDDEANSLSAAEMNEIGARYVDDMGQIEVIRRSPQYQGKQAELARIEQQKALAVQHQAELERDMRENPAKYEATRAEAEARMKEHEAQMGQRGELHRNK